MECAGSVSRYVPEPKAPGKVSEVSAYLEGVAGFEEEYKMAWCVSSLAAKSIAKYDRPQPAAVVKDAMTNANMWVRSHFMRFCKGSRVLPMGSVWCGLDHDTSAGYPWNLRWACKGDFLESEEFQQVYKEYWRSLATEGAELIPLWTVSLKKELRPLEKLREGKVRTFTASPTELTVATNQLCSDFNERFYDAHCPKSWSSVGLSKYHGGFQTVYNELQRHPHAFALDESAYDSSLWAGVLEDCRDMRWEMFAVDDKSEDTRKRLWAVYDSIIHSWMVTPWGDVLVKHTGNPSGSANTIVDNTMVLYRLLAYAWIVIQWRRMSEDRAQALGMKSFEGNVAAVLCGDDNTFTVSDEVVGWFNAITITKIWAELLVVTTTDDPNPRRLLDVDFVSHRFVPITWTNGVTHILPAPETNKILCSLMWGGSSADPREVLLRAFALRNESWANMECRVILERFIDYWKVRHAEELCGVLKIGGADMKMSDIWRSWKSDGQLWELYTQGAERYIEASNSAGLNKSCSVGVESVKGTGREDCRLQSGLVEMPKTAAEKAARKAMKKARKMEVKKKLVHGAHGVKKTLGHMKAATKKVKAVVKALPSMWAAKSEKLYQKEKGSHVHTEVGKDRLAVVAPGLTGVVGQLLYGPPETFANPTLLDAGRLNRLASMYERFKIKSLGFTYVPAMGIDTPGLLLGAWTNNLNATTATGGELIKILQCHEGAEEVEVTKRHTWRLPKSCFKESQEWFYTNTFASEDPLLTIAGAFYLVDSMGSLLDSVTYGELHLEYTLEFSVPTLDSPASGSGAIASFALNPATTTGSQASLTVVDGGEWEGSFTPTIVTTVAAADSIQVPSGTYRMGLDMECTGGDSSSVYDVMYSLADGEVAGDAFSAHSAANNVRVQGNQPGGLGFIQTVTGWVSNAVESAGTTLQKGLDFVLGVNDNSGTVFDTVETLLSVAADVIEDLLIFAFTTDRDFKIHRNCTVVLHIRKGKWEPYKRTLLAYQANKSRRISYKIKAAVRDELIQHATWLTLGATFDRFSSVSAPCRDGDEKDDRKEKTVPLSAVAALLRLSSGRANGLVAASALRSTSSSSVSSVCSEDYMSGGESAKLSVVATPARSASKERR